MAVILDSTCIKRPRKRRRLGVLEPFHTQQGEFWREDIKAFFFLLSFLPSERGSLGRSPLIGRLLVAQSQLQIS